MSESNSLNRRDALKGMAAVSLGIATGAQEEPATVFEFTWAGFDPA